MTEITIDWDVRIAMRDGVHLSARIYRPVEQVKPRPSILTVTPYTADRYHQQAKYFASRGRPFVIVDSRGRGDSGGCFRPYVHEAADGEDCVQWLERQPYCDGQVGMWGGSYGGHAQWATARGRPRALKTICPTAAPWLGLDFPMRNNISYPYLLQWIAMTRGRATQNNVFTDTALWSDLFSRWFKSGRSFRELDSCADLPSEQFQEWIAHPELDAYWDAQNPSDEEYARMNIPVLTITGSYDDDQVGALEHYRRHLEAHPASARNHYLIIGPWNHFRTGTPALEFSGIRVGSESLVNVLELHEAWYAWTMDGAPRPEFFRDKVAYYVMGAEQWRYTDSLAAVARQMTTYHLDSVGSCASGPTPGRLQELPGMGPPDEYYFDPTNSSAPELGAELKADPESVLDDTLTSSLGSRVLKYQTRPLEQAVEAAGFFRLKAWISINTPDTDLYATVHEVLADGRAIRLSSDAIRARYRESLRQGVLIGNSAPLLYDFHRFTFVARTLAAGSRLRLTVAPVGRLIDACFWQPNFNAGGLVSEENRSVGRPVTVRLFHDRDHASVFEVPIGVR